MEAIVGFDVHRGCLAAGDRTQPSSIDDVLTAAASSSFIVVVDGVSNADNMGAIFRNARAFGAGGVLLSPACCDPLYRKAIRVSIGATLLVPYAVLGAWPEGLRVIQRHGYQVAALTVRDDAVELDRFADVMPPRLAWLLGHEGHGVSQGAAAIADVAVRIPMVPGADSINVAAAAGIAMYFSRCRPAGFPASVSRAGVD
jgi:tRNA G18 (ribose-2'-O)-methylase SpoU